MDSFTPCCEKPPEPSLVLSLSRAGLAKLRPAWLALLIFISAFCFGASPAHSQTIEIPNFRVEQTADGLYLSAGMQFELPSALEEALLKGVPLSFVAQTQVLRDRWYWTDKSVAQATRTVRLSYQPLTRRWRVNVSAGSPETSGLVNLGQNFDQLAEAMTVVRRIARWKIAEASEMEPDSRHSVSFRFFLDTSQLPRPMQIGITGNTDWNLSVQRVARPER